MKKVNLTVIESYKSIPAGFVWENIPSFSIITGINGIGKSQLLEILRQRDKNNNAINCQFKLRDETGINTTFILSSPQIRELDLTGLLSYFADTGKRIINIEQWENAIKIWTKDIARIDDKLKENITSEDKRRYEYERTSLHSSILSYINNIQNASVFSYEEELKRVSMKCNKTISELTEAEIRKYANPYFNDFSEIEDFERYIRQEHEEYKEAVAQAADEKDLNKVETLAEKEKPYQIINRIFLKYGFGYYKMLDPFPKLKERAGEIRFEGQSGEIIEYSDLSSGEQMIVKFILWSFGRNISGMRINTLILDEPDSHLHPTMCKMMVDILSELSQSKEYGGAGIRVIITSHSPSTVAFAPEGTLFVMEKNSLGNKIIRHTDATESVGILSDGIFTYNKAVRQFALALASNQDTIVFVEGKTDVFHLKKANEILDYNLPFDVVDLHDAVSLANFIKSTPAKMFPGKKFVAVFDADREGYDVLGKIKGNTEVINNVKIITAIQCENRSFALSLVAPKDIKCYCPIEFLYPLEYLKESNMLEKRNFQDFQNVYQSTNPTEASALLGDFNKETSLRPFKVKDFKKDSFSHQIESETNPELFRQFAPTLDCIKAIINYPDK